MTVAEVVADGLAQAGAERVFVADLHLGATRLVTAARARGLAAVDAGDAAAAALAMAAVTGDLAGVPGVAVLGAGACAEDAVVATAHAATERAPVIVITERVVGRRLAGAGKATLDVTPPSAAHWMAHAVHLALRAPRGPVHLVLDEETAAAPAVPVAVMSRAAALPPPAADLLDEAARLLAGAGRPVIIAGLECRSGATARWVRAFAESVPAPVLVTPGARGVLPDPHPLVLDTLTGPAMPAGHPVLERAELLVLLGVDPGELACDDGGAPVVRLARAPAPGPAAVEVVGELPLILEELAPRLRRRAGADWDVAWLDRVRRDLAAARRAPAGRLTATRAVEIARELLPAGAVAAADAGPPAAAVLAGWQAVAPHELLVPRAPWPAFGLAAAVAVRHARPGVPLVVVAGGDSLSRRALEQASAGAGPFLLLAAGVGDGSPALDHAGAAGLSAAAARAEPDLRRLLAGAAAGSRTLIAVA